MDEDGNIKHLIQVYNRRKPARMEKARIREDEDDARGLLADADEVRADFKRRGRDEIAKAYLSRLVYLLREDRNDLLIGLFFFLPRKHHIVRSAERLVLSFH